ncbi:hypothetical protein QFC22_002416 [Naganishia vaughanmartiniae]|uniref:Uncharacterized protein n=1 Tax=Naganishia vaughanmartiniae TaxID=1424756 RepID=A0ACC2XCM3_9TREE|nr:hypothetical protein QFC22_002416 [Naganishia vaughanmartiniae]
MSKRSNQLLGKNQVVEFSSSESGQETWKERAIRLQTPQVQRFSADWPANEMIKIVLRDQRTKARQVQIDELVINTIYNMHIAQSEYDFPARSQPHTPKPDKKRTVGRPPLTDVQKAAMFIPPSTVNKVADITKGIKADYKWMKSLPSFTFTAEGSVIIPPAPRPPPPDDEDEPSAKSSRCDRDVPALTPSTSALSQSHQSGPKQTARRSKIVENAEVQEATHQKKRQKRLIFLPSVSPAPACKGKGKATPAGSTATLFPGYRSSEGDSGPASRNEDESDEHEYAENEEAEDNEGEERRRSRVRKKIPRGMTRPTRSPNADLARSGYNQGQIGSQAITRRLTERTHTGEPLANGEPEHRLHENVPVISTSAEVVGTSSSLLPIRESSRPVGTRHTLLPIPPPLIGSPTKGSPAQASGRETEQEGQKSYVDPVMSVAEFYGKSVDPSQ